MIETSLAFPGSNLDHIDQWICTDMNCNLLAVIQWKPRVSMLAIVAYDMCLLALASAASHHDGILPLIRILWLHPSGSYFR